MVIANHLVPDRRHVSMVGTKGREKGRAELDSAVLQGRRKLGLWCSLWAALEDVSFDPREHISAERIGTGEILVSAVDDLPRNRRALRLKLQLTPVNVLDRAPVNVGDFTDARALSSQLKTLLIGPEKLVRLLPFSNVAGAASPRVCAGDRLHGWWPATSDKTAICVGLHNHVVCDLTGPGGQSDIQTPNLRAWKVLDRLDSLPVLDPLARLAWNIDPNPTALGLAAKIHPPERHIPDLYLAGLPKAQDAPWKAL